MSDNAPGDLVVLVTHGTGHELSSVAFTIANGGITARLEISIFLTSSGVDLARRSAIDSTEVKPLEPLARLVEDFLGRGGTLWACTPCGRARGYRDDDLRDGVIVTGAGPMHELVRPRAATLSF